MGKRVDDWDNFSFCVRQHIAETENGHYSGNVDLIEFMDGHFGHHAIYKWIGDVIKYVCRFPRTRNHTDLFKAAHYVCRMFWTQ